MGHLRTVETRNVVASNVMMSNAPKMTCPGDPRAQTHTQIVRAYLRCAKHTYNTRPFENGSAGRREEGLANSYRLHKKQKTKCHELISHT